MSDESSAKDHDVHAGYEFESGMFSRVRSWVDLAPWLRLFRVLRLLASPAYVAVVVVAMWVTMLLDNVTGIRVLSPLSGGSLPEVNLIAGFFGDAVAVGPSPGAEVPAISLAFVVVVLLRLAIWTPVVQVLARAGASLTADRGLPPIGETIRLTLRRLLYSHTVPLVIAAAVLVAMLGLFLLCLPALLFSALAIKAVAAWLAGLAAIPIGVLIAGSIVAIPIAWAAMVCEKDPDPIDSLSRGFEALFRRPLHLVGYVALAAILLAVMQWFSFAVVTATHFVVMSLSGIIGQTIQSGGTAALAISSVAKAWLLALQFGLLGGIYLLLRRDTGGQEVEDFWQPDPVPQPPLPELPPQAYES